MRIEQAYSNLLPQLEDVHNRARTALSSYVSSKDFLLSSRLKTLNSVIDKIETGRYASLTDFDDLVALTIIVDTRSQVRDAVAHLKRQFDVVSVRGRSTLSDERIFDFDATRVYARLTSSIPSPLNAITFEIQVRTLLQHAWSKITHGLVYKPRHLDPRRIRLASEILANLEAIDRSLSTFATVARGVKIVNRPQSTKLNKIITMVDHLVDAGVIPPERRPSNGRRFSENVAALVASGQDTDKAVAAIEAFYRGQSGKFPQSVTLLQLAMVALYRAGMLRAPAKTHKYRYVTPDLVSLFPDTKSLSPIVTL